MSLVGWESLALEFSVVVRAESCLRPMGLDSRDGNSGPRPRVKGTMFSSPALVGDWGALDLKLRR